jgi:dihydroorotase
MSGTFLIRGGTIVNPDSQFGADVLVANGVVAEVGTNLSADTVLDATGRFVSSGFVDLHTHLREPGKEEAETIESGSRAAALGGYTAVVAMPNTDPAQDNIDTVRFVRAQGERAGLCEVHPSGCITVGRAGERLVDFGALAAEGVVIFTDDGNGVQNGELMARALELSATLGVTMAQHCEVSSMTAGAAMHDGECCSNLGLPGWPSVAEIEMVRRDIELARRTGGRLHLLHLSTAESVALVRAAKAEGLPITAEATPHHLSLDDSLLKGFDPVFKVNPPLRTVADIEALKTGLRDGTIDAVATDHAPHAGHTKELTIDAAPPGMLGLETALAVVNTSVQLDPRRTAEVMSWNPARIAGISATHGRPIAVGEPAQIAVWDLTTVWSVSRDALASRSRNTPYHGMTVRGRVHHTINKGDIVVRDGKAMK